MNSSLAKIFLRKLSTRLIIIVSVGILLAAALFYFYVTNIQRELFKESFTRAAEGTLETVRLGIEIGLNNEDFSAINTVFEWAKTDEFLNFIVLTESENEILASFPENISYDVKELESLSGSESLESELYIISAEWLAKFGQGKIYLGFSTKRITDYEDQLLSDVGFVIIIALLAGIILVIIIATSIANPLENLRKITNRIRQGELDSRADEKRGGFEISSVARDFNLMVQKLVDTQTSLESELNDAADFVKELLPHHMIQPVKINWIFVPSIQLGGDSFGYHFIDDKNLAIYLIDVSGHGVGASLYSTTVLNIIREGSLVKTNFKDPADVLRSLNKTFQMDKYDGKYFTIWYGVLNIDNNELKYASAGHPPAILFRGNNIIEVGNSNMIVGGLPEIDYEYENISLLPKDRLLIFSDGLYELRKTNGEILAFKEFKTILKSNLKQNNSLENILEQLKELSGKKNLSDDCSLIDVEIL